MYINPESVEEAKNGNVVAMQDVLGGYLAHIHAMADLLSNARSDGLSADTVSNAGLWLEAEAAAARDVLRAWGESRIKGGQPA